MSKTTHAWQQSTPSLVGLETARRFVACVEATSYALLSRRILSTIAICSMVWLASLWLAAAIALAQESSSNESGITVTRPASPSATGAETSRLVIGMVDPGELESDALQNSAVQPTNPGSVDQQNGQKIPIPIDSRGSEYASLAALASAPPSSLLSADLRKSSGRADSGSATSGNKSFVYRLGALNLVVNGLPNSFSVPSRGADSSGAR